MDHSEEGDQDRMDADHHLAGAKLGHRQAQKKREEVAWETEELGQRPEIAVMHLGEDL